MGNNSGLDHVIINNRERAVSTDINRLQQQAGRALAQVLSRWVNDEYDDEVGGGADWNVGVAEVQGTDAVPLSADIFGGLKVRPFSDHLLVTEGSLGAKATPGSPEYPKDSEYVLVDDPGVTSASALPFVSNVSGSLRVDVVECEIVEQILTTENRDIYDPVTGLFTASLVSKSAGARLAYRIREGIGGTGYPGHAAGWLPLAIAIHQVASSNFTDVDFYDVRPLIQMRSDQPTARKRNVQYRGMDHYKQGVHNGGSGDYYIGGEYDIGNTVHVGAQNRGYKMSGTIGPTLPGTSTLTEDDRRQINVTDTSYFVGGLSTTPAERWLYLVTVQPFGLPMWRRYTQEAAGGGERQPGPNFGLFAIANANMIEDGATSSDVVLPVGYGLPNASEPGRFVGMIRQNVSGIITSTFNGNMFWLSSSPAGLSVAGTGVGSGTAATADFNLSSRGSASYILPGYCSGFYAHVNVEADITGVTVSMTNSNLTASLTADDGAGSAVGAPSKVESPCGIEIATTFLAWTLSDFFALTAEDVPNSAGNAGGFFGGIELRAIAGFANTGTLTHVSSLVQLHGFRMGY